MRSKSLEDIGIKMLAKQAKAAAAAAAADVRRRCRVAACRCCQGSNISLSSFQLLEAEPLAEVHPLILPLSIEVEVAL